jgi:predicted O-methyltransferase YrrM
LIDSPAYLPVDPKGVPTEKTVFAPYIFGSRAEVWQKIFGPNIDEMTSDPRTFNLLSTLLVYAEPKTIVEVGTYRGWGTATLAETLRVYDLPGHVWSCDPVDHGVHEMLDQASLSDRVTLVHGTFEQLLEWVPEMDFCYVDGADRLPYTKLALGAHAKPRDSCGRRRSGRLEGQ